jgi:16S rRNA (adenine1518-N6/adenine1519-N6)-dimethyltransferase
VVEIGPGIGPLTRELSKRADKVVAIELDKSLLPILGETLADRDNVEIVPGDVLKIDLPALVRERLSGLDPIVCANLPYNITSPAITALLEANCFSSVTVMIQREVARRVCAQPGTADYGYFSIFCQYYTTPELLFDVPPECFLPAPKVTSSVLRMVPHEPPAEVNDPERFFAVVKAAFAQRRKTLLNALSAAFGAEYSKQELADCLARCGFSPDVRGERLNIPKFACLSNILTGTPH